MRKCGEGKTTRIMMATVPQVTSGSGLRKFQSDGFLLDRVYTQFLCCMLFVYLCKHYSSNLLECLHKYTKRMSYRNCVYELFS